MSLVGMGDVLHAASLGRYGVGAFNVGNLGQAAAVLEAAEMTDSPVIVQTIAGAHGYGSDEFFWAALLEVCDRANVPVALHLDHGPDAPTCRRAIDFGFTGVMIDGSLDPSGQPADFEANVDVTAEVTEYAHKKGITVEGELGTIGGSEDGRIRSEIVLADPDQAVEFVERTQVDVLAAAVGTSHGAFKFSAPPQGSVLRLDLLTEIHRRLPSTYLVLHGSSSLPDELRNAINAAGGQLADSWGVSDEEKVSAIALGVNKVNQGMDSHLAYTAGVRTYLRDDPAEVDPARYTAAGREAMVKQVAMRMAIFGQAGRAADVKATQSEPSKEARQHSTARC